MRALHLFARTLFGVVLAVLVVGLLTFGFLQTPPGKAFLAQLGSKLASGNGLTVSIRDISGAVPWDMSVGEIEVSDPKGPFARVSDFDLSWSPFSLISGTARIKRLAAAEVEVLRKPELPPAPADTAKSGGMPGIRLVLDQLQIADIRIAEPVAGQAANLALIGSASLMEPSRGLSLNFDLARKDQPGRMNGKVRYVPDSHTLDLDMQAHEPAGGLVARLAGLEGQPALDATLRGLGPLTHWDGSLKVTAGEALNLQANTWVRAEGPAHRVTFALDGDVSRVLPANIAPLLAGQTRVEGDTLVNPDLAISIARITANAAAGSAQVSGAVNPVAGTVALKFKVAAPSAAPFAAIAPGIAFANVTAKGDVEGALAAPKLAATLRGEKITASGYGMDTATVTLAATPDAAGTYAWRTEGTLDGLSAADKAVAAALGRSGTFTVSGTLPQAGEPSVSDARIALSPLDLTFAGSAAPSNVTGTLAVPRLDLAALAPLAGQKLAGTLTLNAKVSTPAGGGFAADLTGETRDFETGDPVLNGVLGRTAKLNGGLSYGAGGAINVRHFVFGASGLDLAVDGRIDQTVADLTARFGLADIARLDKRLAGRVEGNAAFSGTLDALAVKARIALPQGTAMGRPVRDLAFDITGTDLTRLPGGTLNATGAIGGKPLGGSARFASAADGARSLDALNLSLGSARATGNLALAASGLMAGQLKITAPDVSDLSALALQEMSGAITAALTLDADAGRQRIVLDADASKLTAAGVRLERGDIDLTIVDPAGAPALTGKAVLTGLNSGGVALERATLDAAPAGANATALKLDGLVQGTSIATAGRLTTEPGRYTMRLDSLRLANGGTVATLSAPATLSYADGFVAVDRFALASGGGSAVVAGRAGEQLDLSVDARALPLAIVNLAAPGQGISGTMTGQAKLAGPAASPSGRYNFALSRISQPELQQAGVGPLDLKAEGQFEGGRVTIRSTLSGPALAGMTINGSAPMGAGALDIAVKGQVSLGIANAVLAVSGARAQGTATVDATIRGTTQSPSAGGTVRISGGRYDDALNGVTLQNIEATLTGTDRSVTLSSLSARTQNGGTVNGRGQVALDPAGGFPGRAEVTLQNAGLVNSELMRLVVDGNIDLSGALATRPSVGGRITVRNLDINVPDRLASSAAQMDVRHVNVKRGTAPTTLKGNQAKAAQGKAQRDARAQQRAARAQSPFVASLNLAISAPSRVFVRGMGIDAELGGDITLGGTTAEPVANGGFQMRRGRFDILGRRLEFSRGIVTFRGSLDPELDFVAESSSADVTARVLVQGPSSDPEITFTSTPTLPQDEVVARLLFGKATGELSTGQALQLAQTVAQFSGAGGGAQLDQLRRQFGLDSLDFGANSEGTGGEVGFGRRLNDNVYIGVKQGTTSGSSRATIDVDVTKNIRIQGGAGADGGGEVGIGAQWDY
ncbi:translocation/assembly module TamB domain-containing protein [Xanthobacteraceae bacterium A53D]